MAEIWQTQEEFEKRKEHLDYLKSTRTLEIAEMLKIARGFGDLSENAEYDAAKSEQAKTTSSLGPRIQRIVNSVPSDLIVNFPSFCVKSKSSWLSFFVVSSVKGSPRAAASSKTCGKNAPRR